LVAGAWVEDRAFRTKINRLCGYVRLVINGATDRDRERTKEEERSGEERRGERRRRR
jgi:hypothetical protein